MYFMLSKCSGSACIARFLHLGEGRLFRLISASDPGRLEYFWLCDHCSSTITLRLAEEGSVVAVAIPKPIQGVPDGVDHSSFHRDRGLMLRSVPFPVPEPVGDSTGARLKAGRRAA